MNTEQGYICLWRKIREWEWYEDRELFWFFVWMMMKANWKDKKWRGVLIPRGSFVSSRKNLSQACHRSQQEIRSMCQRLKSTNELTIKSTNKYTIYTIVKYNEFQVGIEKSTSKSTSKPPHEQPTINQQSTTTKEREERKELKKEEPLSLSPPFGGDVEREKSSFFSFWESYPKKIDQTRTWEVWQKLRINGELEQILAALSAQKQSAEWQRDSGRFIPHPVKWLQNRRWEYLPPRELSTEEKVLQSLQEMEEKNDF